jgi:hypothetical protein
MGLVGWIRFVKVLNFGKGVETSKRCKLAPSEAASFYKVSSLQKAGSFIKLKTRQVSKTCRV